MKYKKKSLILTIVALLLLIAVVGGAAYAYFAADLGGGTNANLNATTGTTDSLSFSVGDAIRIHADLDNFKEGEKDLSDSTIATATLKANNATNEATGMYNIFFIIDDNDFTYTTEDEQAEIILKVTDPTGKEVENITGLKKVEDGFDITMRKGGYLIMADYDIEVSGTEPEEQEWTVEVTLKNLDANQNVNMGKALNGRIYITAEKISTYEVTQIKSIEAATTYKSIKADANVTTGTAEIDKYYFGIEEKKDTTAFVDNKVMRLSNILASKDDVEYIETTESSYEFTDLEDNKTYTIYSYAKDKYGFQSNIYQTEITTDEYNLPTVDTVSHSSTLNSITVNVSASKGDNEVAKYYYSSDGGNTFEESTESSHIFSGLNDTTDYNIVIKVEDTYGKFSTDYTETISTVTYINPSITTVTTAKTWNSATLTVTASKGTNNVSKYFYKLEGGSWSSGQDSNVISITRLESSKTYNYVVKVSDTNGRESNEYPVTVTTDNYVLPKVTATFTADAKSITINAVGTNGTVTIVSYMYSKNGGSTWETSSNSTYTFGDLTSDTPHDIQVKVIDSNGKESTPYKETVRTEASGYHAACNDDTLACQIAKKSETDNTIYYHDETLDNGAEDYSYRYAGKNPNNYVCFGSTATTCPTNNLYRIIGVFNVGTSSNPNYQIKLIKASFYGSTHYWSGSSSNQSNVWANSTFNIGTLNGTYLNGLGTTWSSKIVTHIWKVGGYSSNAVVVKTVFDNEVKNNSTTYSAKIGLMYVSDYGYAASPEKWTTILNNYGDYNNSGAEVNNWLYIESDEWTISRYSIWTDTAMGVDLLGCLGGARVYNNAGARPSFYLESSVKISSGYGTSTDPYRIS